MDDKLFIEACKSFESSVGEPKVREIKRSLEYLMKAYIDFAEAFDVVKRAIFYGSEIDRAKFINKIRRSQSYANFAIERMRSDEDDSETVDYKVNHRLLHALIGFVTETGELMEQFVDDDSNMDVVNVIEELGDIQWYEAVALDELDTDWRYVRERNYAKLSKRYPNRFTREHAENRNLEAERQALEG